jgi:hypothetical protein
VLAIRHAGNEDAGPSETTSDWAIPVTGDATALGKKDRYRAEKHTQIRIEAKRNEAPHNP